MGSSIRRVAAVAVVWGVAGAAFAQPTSPVGRWRTTDDKTGQPKAIILIAEVNGELQGTVERVFSPPAASASPLCDECPGDRRHKPVVGMQILWGLKKEGDDYAGGRILLPDTGKTYRCRLHLIDGGKKLEMRAFIGFAMAGRTETWVRE